MIRVLHTADLHLGVETYGKTSLNGINSRIKDYLYTLDAMINEAVKANVDVFIVTGDIFENERPTNYVVSEFGRRVRKLLDNEITVVLTPGNHETSSSARVPSALEIFKALKPIKQGEPPTACHVLGNQPVKPGDEDTLGDLTVIQTKSGPLQILAMPYPRRSELLTADELKNNTKDENKATSAKRYLERIRTLAKKTKDGLPSIFIGHFGLKEAELQPGKKGYLADDVVLSTYDLMAALSSSPARFTYCALGHYHSPQMPSPNLQPSMVEEDMDGEKDELSGRNACRDWENSDFGLILLPTDAILDGKKPVQFMPVVYSGAPCRRDFSDGSRPRKLVVVEVGQTNSTGRFIKLHQTRSLRQLTIEDPSKWQEELGSKFCKGFWAKGFDATKSGGDEKEIERALDSLLPIFRIKMPEEGKPFWPQIKAYLKTLAMFDQIREPYYPPTQKSNEKIKIAVAESPFDAARSYLSSQKDEFVEKNRQRILEEADKIMQEAGAL